MKICWGLCGSFCTVGKSLEQMEKLANQGHDLLPVGSFAFSGTDTRFGCAGDLIDRIEKICGKKMISTLVDAEPIGPVWQPDITVISPASGNTLSKLSCGIYDTPVTLAAKAHLRTGKPLLIALATNDALSGNFENIARLYNRKNVFFVPVFQDDPLKKPFSMISAFDLLPDALCAALEGRQLPLFALRE